MERSKIDIETPWLKGEKRSIFGKKVKKLRAQGLLPAILYGHGIAPQPITVSEKDFQKIFWQVGTSGLVNLKIEDQKPVKVLIHEPDRHPVTDKVLHVDFYAVKMTERIKTEIPIRPTGVSPAVEELGGSLIFNKDSIEVECLPQDLVHEIEVDVSLLKTFQDSIKISDLKVPFNIDILGDREEVIALVTPPRTEEELKELEEVPAEEEKEVVEKIEAEEEKKEGKKEELAAQSEQAEKEEPERR